MHISTVHQREQLKRSIAQTSQRTLVMMAPFSGATTNTYKHLLDSFADRYKELAMMGIKFVVVDRSTAGGRVIASEFGVSPNNQVSTLLLDAVGPAAGIVNGFQKADGKEMYGTNYISAYNSVIAQRDKKMKEAIRVQYGIDFKTFDSKAEFKSKFTTLPKNTIYELQ